MFDRKRTNKIDTHHEKKFLKSLFKDRLLRILAENGAFVAGGCIRSIFTSQPIRDIDIFFRDQKSYQNVKAYMEKMSGEYKLICNTSRADTFESKATQNSGQSQLELTYGPSYLVDNNIQIQLVCMEFDEPIGTISRFDFRCCMGAFDFLEDEFIFDENFMSDNARRILTFNVDCWKPLASLFRLQKYQQKGYRITDESLLLMTLAINQTQCDTYGKLLKELRAIPSNRAIRNITSHSEVHPWSKNKKLLDAPVIVDQVSEWLTQAYTLEGYENKRAIKAIEEDTRMRDDFLNQIVSDEELIS